MKMKAYLNYKEQFPLEEHETGWKELHLPKEPYSSIDNAFQSIHRQFPQAQIRLEWTYDSNQ
mgnify:CR=1 FL=1